MTALPVLESKDMTKLLSNRPFLILIMVLQIICALFVLQDGLLDLLGLVLPIGFPESHLFEWLVGVALLVSVFFTLLQIRRLLRSEAQMKQSLKAASGAFGEYLEQQFTEWDLSPSERDVALFAIKGSSIAEISELRGTKEGTIKAQLNAIYRKADVTGRPQLISYFIEGMLDGLEPA